MHLSQKDIIKYSLTVFIVVFSILIFIDSFYEPELVLIENITIKNINQYTKIKGNVVKQNLISDMLFLTIKNNTSTIPAIMFDYNQSLNQSLEYYFIGKITVYKNAPELIIYEINQLES